MREQTKHFYEFGPFRLDTAEHLLWRNDVTVPLTPKAYETLVVLVEHRGHVVGKDELMKEIWPETFVEEANLAHNISLLRRALGESPSEQQYIQTVPKRGYRFVASVQESDREETESVIWEQPAANKDAAAAPHASSAEYLISEIKHRWRVALPALATLVVALASISYFTRDHGAVDSLAVLPLENVGGNPDTEYLSDGITESLINNLSQISSLRVMARSTVFRYKGREVDPQKVGRELGVKAVLTGRIAQRGETLVMQADLVKVEDGSQLWGERFNRRTSELLAVQEEISREIAEKLRLRLSGNERERLTKPYTEDAEAYQEYVKGRYHLNKRTEEGFQQAIKHFQRAIEIDAAYALAYAGLADCYNMLGGYGLLPPKESYPLGKAAAARALHIDASLPEAHAALGFVKARYDWDWAGAETEFQRAIELNHGYAPAHSWYAFYHLIVAGRVDEAIRGAIKSDG